MRERRIAAFASAIGTTIEWYDFFIYGLAASLVFNQAFFPASEPIVGTLIAFGTFATGYLGRPIGALLFGHFGDRIGRKSALVTTMMIMGVGTAFIGLLPTYATIGIWAPLLLTVLRIFQGIGIAGEWGGAVLLAVEYAPKRRRGLYGSWPQIGVPVGLLLATGAFSLLNWATTSAAFQAWGWRVAFLFSAVLVAVGLVIRLKIMESPAFRALQESGEVAKAPLKDLVVSAKKSTILLAMGTKWAEGVGFNTWAVFSIAYLTDVVSFPEDDALTAVMIAAAVCVLFIPTWGRVSDSFGRTRTFGTGAALLGVVAVPAFLLFGVGGIAVPLVLVVVFGVAYPMMFAPQGALYAELFEPRIRYSGISVVFQFASIVSSGLTPLILTTLLIWGGNSPWLICAYIMAVATVSTLCVYGLRNRAHHLDESVAPATVNTAG
ncbi:MAG: MFS transporter [Streptosporangiales bacterium]|nr:MFS transporter [Streptosporangiales bacterium]